jgi:hypothetical protein
MNSSDEENISRGKRGSDPCEALQRPQREAARKDFSRMQVWRSAILVENQVFPDSVAACLMGCICVAYTCMWDARVIPEFLFRHHRVFCIKLYASFYDLSKHLVSRTLCEPLLRKQFDIVRMCRHHASSFVLRVLHTAKNIFACMWF